MIQLTVRSHGTPVKLTLPTSDSQLAEALAIPPDQQLDPAILPIESVFHPPQLSYLTGHEMNMDEMNYLARRLDGLDDRELQAVLAEAQHEQLTSCKDLINRACQPLRFTLITNLSDLNEVGRRWTLDQELCMGYVELNQKDYSSTGRQLLSSGTGIITPNGILLPHDVQLEETYNGKQFPDYLDHEHLLTICIENGKASEYLDLPTDNIAIGKSIRRVGEEGCSITVDDYSFQSSKRMAEIFSGVLEREGVYKLNEVVSAMQSNAFDPKRLENMNDLPTTPDSSTLIQLAQSNSHVEERYYFPLFAAIEDSEDGEPTPIDNSFLVEHQEAIAAALVREQSIGDESMADYYDGSGCEKLFSAVWTVEELDGQLYGRVDVQLTAPFTADEEDAFRDWIEGQNSDGLGEGFEQRPIHTDDGDLYVSMWDGKADYFVYDSQQMERYLLHCSPQMSGI